MARELKTVVVTGMGCITARGDFTLSSAPMLRENTNQNEAQIFLLPGFKLENYLTSQKTYLDRCSALALAGCALALRDAGLEWPLSGTPLNTQESAEQSDDLGSADLCGITLGTHLGCIETMKVFWDKATERGAQLANPLLFSHSYFNSPISLCAIEFGLKGYHTTINAGHESGISAVRAAYDAIRLGHVATMLCGGVEAWTPARAQMEPAENLGEASAFFVLESSDHATNRGAKSRIALDDAILDAASRAPQVTSNFGDCGGASSALCLYQQFASQL